MQEKELGKVFGQRIKQYRTTMGITMNAFAKAAQIDTPYYHRIENGTSLPGFRILYRLFRTYKTLKPNYLFDLDGEGHGKK